MRCDALELQMVASLIGAKTSGRRVSKKVHKIHWFSRSLCITRIIIHTRNRVFNVTFSPGVIDGLPSSLETVCTIMYPFII